MEASQGKMSEAKRFVQNLISNINLLNQFIAEEQKVINAGISPTYFTEVMNNFLSQKGYQCTYKQVSQAGHEVFKDVDYWQGNYTTELKGTTGGTNEGPTISISNNEVKVNGKSVMFTYNMLTLNITGNSDYIGTIYFHIAKNQKEFYGNMKGDKTYNYDVVGILGDQKLHFPKKFNNILPLIKAILVHANNSFQVYQVLEQIESLMFRMKKVSAEGNKTELNSLTEEVTKSENEAIELGKKLKQTEDSEITPNLSEIEKMQESTDEGAGEDLADGGVDALTDSTVGSLDIAVKADGAKDFDAVGDETADGAADAVSDSASDAMVDGVVDGVADSAADDIGDLL